MQPKSYIDGSSVATRDAFKMNDHLSVISLKRTPGRLQAFFHRNEETLRDWKVHVIDGVDGILHKELLRQSRLISSNVAKGWTAGAIGSALSHMLGWRMCINIGAPLVIAEDDAILANNLKGQLEVIPESQKSAKSFFLLGWNLDSLLQAEVLPGTELISLFEPAYPSENELRRLVNSSEARKSCALKRCFGLPAYRVTPDIAQTLLTRFNPLIAEQIEMGRGIPRHYSETLDGLLNNQYEEINAKIAFPPLALALNNPNESLTRKQKFQQNFMS